MRLLPLLALTITLLSACDSGGPDAVVANPDSATVLPGQSVVIDVLGNDSGTGLTIETFQARSDNGGTVTKTASERLSYRPRGGFLGDDSFTYVARAGSGDISRTTTVSVLVR